VTFSAACLLRELTEAVCRVVIPDLEVSSGQ